MFIPDRNPFGSRDVSAPCVEPHSLEQHHERNRGYAITTVMSLHETFDGRQAAAMRLVNESVPLAQLRDQGMKQFLDDKTFKPGLGAYRR